MTNQIPSYRLAFELRKRELVEQKKKREAAEKSAPEQEVKENE